MTKKVIGDNASTQADAVAAIKAAMQGDYFSESMKVHKIKTTTLKKLINMMDLQPDELIDILKIDIEGAEYDLLLNAEEKDLKFAEVEEEEFNPDDINIDDETNGNSTPLLSDIKVLSNTVVYDAANNPSVRVVFRVTNSSGKVLKGVDVKRTKQ